MKKAVKARKKRTRSERASEERKGQTKRIKPRNFGQMDGRARQNLIPFTKVDATVALLFGRPTHYSTSMAGEIFLARIKARRGQWSVSLTQNSLIPPSLHSRMLAGAMLFGHAENADQSRKTDEGRKALSILSTFEDYNAKLGEYHHQCLLCCSLCNLKAGL